MYNLFNKTIEYEGNNSFLIELYFYIFKEGLIDMEKKYVVIIQCDIAHNRCSGYACTDGFYERTGAFKDYGDETRYLSFTCGGCCGKSVSAKLEHFNKKLKKNDEIKKMNVDVYLASCMTTDNYHYDRCPHVDYIKDIIHKKGFKNVYEGTYISNNSSALREKGVYKKY